jgi:hypothetical protein
MPWIAPNRNLKAKRSSIDGRRGKRHFVTAFYGGRNRIGERFYRESLPPSRNIGVHFRQLSPGGDGRADRANSTVLGSADFDAEANLRWVRLWARFLTELHCSEPATMPFLRRSAERRDLGALSLINRCNKDAPNVNRNEPTVGTR